MLAPLWTHVVFLLVVFIRVVVHTQPLGLKLQWLNAFQPPSHPSTEKDDSEYAFTIDENVIGIILEDDLEVNASNIICPSRHLPFCSFTHQLFFAFSHCRYRLCFFSGPSVPYTNTISPSKLPSKKSY